MEKESKKILFWVIIGVMMGLAIGSIITDAYYRVQLVSINKQVQSRIEYILNNCSPIGFDQINITGG